MPTFNVSITVPSELTGVLIATLASLGIEEGTPEEKVIAYLKLRLCDDVRKYKADVEHTQAEIETNDFITDTWEIT